MQNLEAVSYIIESPSDYEVLIKDTILPLSNGDIVFLDGDLGAGKTYFVQQISKMLGVTEVVSSPTFTIINTYKGDNVIVNHLDLYRLANEEELINLDLDFVIENGITFIEWASKFEEYFRKRKIGKISIKIDKIDQSKIDKSDFARKLEIKKLYSA